MAKEGYLLETGMKGVSRFAREGFWDTAKKFAKSLGYELQELEGMYWTVGDRERLYSPAKKRVVTVGIVVHDRLFAEMAVVDVGKDGRLYISVEDLAKLC